MKSVHELLAATIKEHGSIPYGIHSWYRKGSFIDQDLIIYRLYTVIEYQRAYLWVRVQATSTAHPY